MIKPATDEQIAEWDYWAGCGAADFEFYLDDYLALRARLDQEIANKLDWKQKADWFEHAHTCLNDQMGELLLSSDATEQRLRLAEAIIEALDDHHPYNDDLHRDVVRTKQAWTDHVNGEKT